MKTHEEIRRHEWDTYYKELELEKLHNRYWLSDIDVDEAVDEIIPHPLPTTLEETLLALKIAADKKKQ